MENAGIDYGMGKTNIDHETGIRYGVISINEVTQAWADSSESVYGPYCPKCGNEIAETFEKMMEAIDKKEQAGKAYHCPKCRGTLTNNDFDMLEPEAFTYNGEGYQAQQSADDPDIFVIKSPYYTYCKFCSPCAPGAGYLMNCYKMLNSDMPINGDIYKQNAENAGYIRAYCFGHDWYEDVETGKEVNCHTCNGSGILNIGKQFHHIFDKDFIIDDNHVKCGTCQGSGKEKETIQKAPYPVFSVATGELVSCD